MQSCLIFIWPLGPCWVWFVRGAELLIQSFLFECQINFMNHKTLPDCSLMMAHYTLALCVNCWVRDKILALFTSPRQDRYLFSFDMFILIIQFPSGFCSLLCHVGNQLTQLSHYPRTQHYTSYSLRRLFMMAVYQKQIKLLSIQNSKILHTFPENVHHSYVFKISYFRSWANTRHLPRHKWGRDRCSPVCSPGLWSPPLGPWVLRHWFGYLQTSQH